MLCPPRQLHCPCKLCTQSTDLQNMDDKWWFISNHVPPQAVGQNTDIQIYRQNNRNSKLVLRSRFMLELNEENTNSSRISSQSSSEYRPNTIAQGSKIQVVLLLRRFTLTHTHMFVWSNHASPGVPISHILRKHATPDEEMQHHVSIKPVWECGLLHIN